MHVVNSDHRSLMLLLDNLCKNQIKCLCVYNIVTDIRRQNKQKLKKEPESSAELSP